MTTLILDFETYYDADYTLKKISTSEYIRDARFKVFGASAKLGAEPTVWVTADELPAFLASIDWAATELIAHHVQFDGLILSEHYGKIPSRYCCTRDLSRLVLQGLVKSHSLDHIAEALGLQRKLTFLENLKGVRDLSEQQQADLAKYANRDADICYQIYQLLAPVAGDTERDLISLTAKLFCDPVAMIDVQRAEAAKLAEQIENERVIAESGATVTQLRKDKFIEDRLTSLGVLVGTKITKTGRRKAALAKSDAFMQELLAHESDEVRHLAAGRIVAKATNQGLRAQRLINAGTTGTCKLPVYLNYHGAGTGRWSGGNKMNLQNLVAGSELRRSIIAPPGYVLAVADSGQIECRGVAWFAGEEWILEAFRQGRDIYCEMGGDIYGRTITKAHKTERFVSKSAVLGLGFTMGWRRFQAFLKMGTRGAPIVHMPDDECMRVVNVYRAKNQRIGKLWEQCDDIIKLLAHGGEGTYQIGKLTVRPKDYSVTLPSGRSLIYPHMEFDGDGYSYVDNGEAIYTHRGAMCENIVQAGARDIIAWQMLNIAKRYRIVTMTHDEIVALVPEDEAEQGFNWMVEQMTTAPAWCSDIPLAAEGGWDKTYSK